MTAYSCLHCRERHGRATSLNGHRCVYYDSDIPTNYDGMYGCPQCAKNCCALCAAELDGICPCGGELVHNVWYHYNGDGCLPPEIVQHPTLESRLAALDRLRSTTRMIQAEYDAFQRLIEKSARFAEELNVAMPDNPGYFIVQKLARLDAISPFSAVNLVLEYATPSNTGPMLELLDDRCIECIERTVTSYPGDDAGWQELEGNFLTPEGYVPYRPPAENVARLRAKIELVRASLANRKDNGMPGA